MLCACPLLCADTRVYVYKFVILMGKWEKFSAQMGKFVDLGIQICQFI